MLSLRLSPFRLEGRDDSFHWRREFVALLSGAAAAWPLAARAQAKVYAIGILETVPRAQNQANFAALLNGLRELGYVEGQISTSTTARPTAKASVSPSSSRSWCATAST
jgi:putative ABC transport system substrate-binding protein